MIGDPVLHEMSLELRNALLQTGADPTNPPANNGPAPAQRAFAEYQRRGGSVYTSPTLFMEELIRKVKMGA